MKTFIVLSFLLLLGAGRVAQAQEPFNVWLPIDTTIKGDTIAFPTVDTGYLATSTTLYTTTDGGKTFTSKGLPPIGSGAYLLQMCWPTSQAGFLLFSTGGNSTELLATTNGGGSWSPIIPAGLPLANISFPTAAIGYATGELNPVGTGYFVAKTTNGGASWSTIGNNNLSLGPITFKDTSRGMYIYYDASNAPQVIYSFDGLKDAKDASEIPFNTQGQVGNFLFWNDDNSWIVQYQGIVRSSDSGKNWTTVLPDDQTGTTYGVISSACFHGPRGFAFGDNAMDFETEDYGATWNRFTNTSPYITSAGTTCAMPADTVAYTTGVGNTAALLRLALAPLAVETPPAENESFQVAENGAWVRFTANPAATARNIQIFDAIGREVTSLPLGPMNVSATLSPGILTPGSYFARLGNQMVKFAVW